MKFLEEFMLFLEEFDKQELRRKEKFWEKFKTMSRR